MLPVSARLRRAAADENTKPPMLQSRLPPPPPPPPPPPADQVQSGHPQKQQEQPRFSVPIQKPQAPARDLCADGGGGTTVPGAIDSQNLSGQVKILNDHVSAMRKYMKVWIKREQMAREAAARRIQRWLRQQRFRQAIASKIDTKRRKRCEKYSFGHCSSGSSLAAIRIQRTWRGVLERRSAILGFSTALWSRQKLRTTAGSRHPSLCVNSKRINAVAHFGADVKQIQQVCVVQERAMIELWDNTAQFRRYLDCRIEKAVVRFQSLWRGWKARKSHMIVTRKPKPHAVISSEVPDDMETMKHTMEIARLSQQVQTLESAVERLLAERQPE